MCPKLHLCKYDFLGAQPSDTHWVLVRPIFGPIPLDFIRISATLDTPLLQTDQLVKRQTDTYRHTHTHRSEDTAWACSMHSNSNN